MARLVRKGAKLVGHAAQSLRLYHGRARPGHDTMETPTCYFNAYAGLFGPPVPARAAVGGPDDPPDKPEEGHDGTATVNLYAGWCKGAKIGIRCQGS
jgi:hypothetical protein